MLLYIVLEKSLLKVTNYTFKKKIHTRGISLNIQFPPPVSLIQFYKRGLRFGHAPCSQNSHTDTHFDDHVIIPPLSHSTNTLIAPLETHMYIWVCYYAFSWSHINTSLHSFNTDLLLYSYSRPVPHASWALMQAAESRFFPSAWLMPVEEECERCLPMFKCKREIKKYIN